MHELPDRSNATETCEHIKETLHLGKHGRLMQICIKPVDRVRRVSLSRGMRITHCAEEEPFTCALSILPRRVVAIGLLAKIPNGRTPPRHGRFL